MFESLPDENAEKKIDRTIKNSRYDDLIAIYGNELQQQLAK